MNELFFELIRVAIGNQQTLSRQPSKKEWRMLYAMAEKQSLIGICFAGIRKLGGDADEGFANIGMPEMLYLTWMGTAASIQMRNEQINKQCVEVQQMIEKAGFRTYIMKGQGNAALYGGELSPLRQPGDIDIYLDGGFDKIMKFVNDTHPTNEVNELEIHYHCYEDTEVEIHYRPFIMRNPLKNKKLQAFFKAHEEECFANRIKLNAEGAEIAVPTSTFNIIHQLAHIRLHLFTEGIGMRQLMDYYFVLKTFTNSPLKGENITKTIESLGLKNFAEAVLWFIKYAFGEDLSHVLGLKADEKGGRLLLDEVMKAGNFGKHDEEQNKKKSTPWYRLWAILFRNIHLWRFDKGDWFWGPLWRIAHKVI